MSTNRSLLGFLGVAIAVGCGGKVVQEASDASAQPGGSGGVHYGGSGGYFGDGAGAKAGHGGTGKGGSSGWTSTGGSSGWTSDGGGGSSGWTSNGGSSGWTSDGGGGSSGWTSNGGSSGWTSDGTGGWAGGTGGAYLSNLGDKCAMASDCAGGICVLPTSDDFRGGGPANGYCSIDCTGWATSDGGSEPDSCWQSGTASECIVVNEDPLKAICLQMCTEGPPLQTLDEVFDPNKCHGRHDVACYQPMVDATGNPAGPFLCMPNCLTDADCGVRKCDPRTNVCTSSPSTGAPNGASCRQWADSEGDAGVPCAGSCITIGKIDSPQNPADYAYVCTSRCVFNELTSGCGFGDTPPSGVCVLALATSGSGDGAYCLEMCDIDSDCPDYSDPLNNAYCDLSAKQFGWPRGFCEWHEGAANGD